MRRCCSDSELLKNPRPLGLDAAGRSNGEVVGMEWEVNWSVTKCRGTGETGTMGNERQVICRVTAQLNEWFATPPLLKAQILT